MMLKKDALLGFVSYFGFLLSITSIYKFMKLAGFSLRKILWSIFVLSSLASIIVQISGTETDVLTASLILSSIVLFWVSIKEKNIVPLIYSSLAYALSIGTKTTGIIAIPAVAPIALSGFYSYNGMSFMEMMKRKLHFAFGNRALTYISTENEGVIDDYYRQMEIEANKADKRKRAK